MKIALDELKKRLLGKDVPKAKLWEESKWRKDIEAEIERRYQEQQRGVIDNRFGYRLARGLRRRIGRELADRLGIHALASQRKFYAEVVDVKINVRFDMDRNGLLVRLEINERQGRKVSVHAGEFLSKQELKGFNGTEEVLLNTVTKNLVEPLLPTVKNMLHRARTEKKIPKLPSPKKLEIQRDGSIEFIQEGPTDDAPAANDGKAVGNDGCEKCGTTDSKYPAWTTECPNCAGLRDGTGDSSESDSGKVSSDSGDAVRPGDTGNRQAARGFVRRYSLQ